VQTAHSRPDWVFNKSGFANPIVSLATRVSPALPGRSLRACVALTPLGQHTPCLCDTTIAGWIGMVIMLVAPCATFTCLAHSATPGWRHWDSSRSSRRQRWREFPHANKHTTGIGCSVVHAMLPNGGHRLGDSRHITCWRPAVTGSLHEFGFIGFAWIGHWSALCRHLPCAQGFS